MSSSPGASVAERLYYDSAELEFSARVTDIRLVATERNEAGEPAQHWQVALDRTAFYPESGGQPWDMGVLIATARSGATLEVAVERVEEDEAGEVWHFVRKPLPQGTEIVGRIDAQRRRDHMQQHSGQHLLSAVFVSQIGARTVSFHLGAETSTIDIVLPEGVEALNPSQIEAAEIEVNRLISDDRPLTPRWHTREETESMLRSGQLRKLPERSGPMRVVEMQGVEFNACGGTHVPSTGAIGGLLLRRVEKAKGGWRVEFLCGQRAVQAARRDFLLLTGVAASLSVGANDVPARIAALQEESRAAHKAQRGLLDELATASAESLLANASNAVVVSARFAEKPIEFAKRIASAIAGAGKIGVIAATQAQQGAIAFAVPAGHSQHAGNLLREVFASHGARGGGSAEMAQGVCSAAQVDEVVEALRHRVG
ncbi:MAG: alanyl-tRNA editing protein [Janthinobacterium lividum]